jgi:hypothetical protein
MKKVLVSAAATLLILSTHQGVLANGFPGAAGPLVTVSDMSTFPNGPAVVGASIMTRDKTGVEASVSTTGLSPAGAYSWWWVVFNNPQYCVDGCGLDDLPPGTVPPAAGDPRVRASLLWGGGFVSDSSGSGFAIARLERGQPPGEVRFGPGLWNVEQAELHIVLRTHGPATAGEVAAQIGAFDGGCTPDEIALGQCPNANVQFAAHPGRSRPHWHR